MSSRAVVVWLLWLWLWLCECLCEGVVCVGPLEARGTPGRCGVPTIPLLLLLFACRLLECGCAPRVAGCACFSCGVLAADDDEFDLRAAEAGATAGAAATTEDADARLDEPRLTGVRDGIMIGAGSTRGPLEAAAAAGAASTASSLRVVSCLSSSREGGVQTEPPKIDDQTGSSETLRGGLSLHKGDIAG